MSVKTAEVTVGTSATALEPVDQSRGGRSVWVKNLGAETVFVGGSDVTTANGQELGAGESASFDLDAGERLYGVVAAGTEPVRVLRTGVA